jgi:LysM repeat protein
MSAGKSFIVVALAALVFGSAAYFARSIWWHEEGIRPNEPSAFASARYVDPSVRTLKEARALFRTGHLAKARDKLVRSLALNPQSPVRQEMRDLVGDINTEIFFSKEPSPRKSEYVVRPGDALYSIAHKLKSSTDLIMRANNLSSPLIHPGETLSIPHLDFTVTIDLPRSRVVVHDSRGFFTQYPIASAELPHTRATRQQTKVMAKTFWKNGTTITRARRDEQATPWIHLRTGYVLYGVDAENNESDSQIAVTNNDSASEETKNKRPPAGIAMRNEDIAELQLLLRKGTPVTIIREQK